MDGALSLADRTSSTTAWGIMYCLGKAAEKAAVVAPMELCDTNVVKMRVLYDVYVTYPHRDGATAKSHLEQFSNLGSAERWQGSWECLAIAHARREKDRWAVRDESVPVMFVIESVTTP